MKTLFKVIAIITCGTVPIAVLFILLTTNLTKLSDNGVYTITVLIIFYYAWYVTKGIDKVQSWFTN
jgi:hypothetical protein